MYISCNIWDRTYTKNNYLLLIWNSSSCIFLATLPWQPDSANLQREGGLWVEGDGGRSRADRLSLTPLYPRLSLAGPHQAELLFLPQSTFEQSQRLSACSQPVCVSQKQSRHLLQDEEVVQTARIDRKPLAATERKLEPGGRAGGGGARTKPLWPPPPPLGGKEWGGWRLQKLKTHGKAMSAAWFCVWFGLDTWIPCAAALLSCRYGGIQLPVKPHPTPRAGKVTEPCSSKPGSLGSLGPALHSTSPARSQVKAPAWHPLAPASLGHAPRGN